MNTMTVSFLRYFFKWFNRFMLLMWRLDMAWWFTLVPRLTGHIMVLNHTGRKSGLRRRTPLNYALVKEELYCTAGFGMAAQWYRNVIEQPQVEVWLPQGRWNGTAHDITGTPGAVGLMRQVLIGSGFAAFSAGINPYRITDDELARVTAGYRLIHIARTQTLTVGDRPGDLGRVWQVTALILLVIAISRKRRL